MRAGLVGIFFFAAVLAAGHYFAAPMFCRGALSLPTLDPVQLCTDGALNRQGSMLLYFFAVAAAMFFGILAALVPGRRKVEDKGPEKPETFEEIVAAQEKTASPAVVVPVVATSAAAAALSAEASAASVPPSVVAETKPDEPQPTPIDVQKSESAAEAVVTDAVLAAAKEDAPGDGTAAPEEAAGDKKSADEKTEEKTDEKAAADKTDADKTDKPEAPVEKADLVEVIAEDESGPAQAASLEDVRAAFESVERDSASAPQAVVAPATAPAETPPEPANAPAEAEAVYAPDTLATAEAISAGLSSNQSGARKPFEGTVEELVERFRQLRLIDGTNSVAQAQRLLDESTLGALAKGVDPKQHLSDVAHLVLAEDPDLKSSVVRGVVVHIASRLKELGVAQRTPVHPVR